MPGEQNTKKTEPEFLNSWKEISSYMGRGVRTLQRYEIQFGLPIRRPSGRSRSAVMATRAELDAWVAASPIRESYQLSNVQGKRSAIDMTAMKDAMQEMQKLKQQMRELRAEHQLALNLFIDSVHNLHRALNTAQGLGSNGVIGPPPGGDEFWLEQQFARKTSEGRSLGRAHA